MGNDADTQFWCDVCGASYAAEQEAQPPTCSAQCTRIWHEEHPQPAPAPLPEVVRSDIEYLRRWASGRSGPLSDMTLNVLAHITTQARRLAEVEAELAEASAAAHCHKAAFEEQAVQLRAEEARVREMEAQISASKQNERRWIAKGEEAIAERNAANAALEAIKKHQEIIAGTGAAQMSTTWNIADAHLRSIGSTRAALAATEVPA